MSVGSRKKRAEHRREIDEWRRATGCETPEAFMAMQDAKPYETDGLYRPHLRKRQYKFNGGRGAVLCSNCSTIVCEGLGPDDDEKEARLVRDRHARIRHDGRVYCRICAPPPPHADLIYQDDAASALPDDQEHDLGPVFAAAYRRAWEEGAEDAIATRAGVRAVLDDLRRSGLLLEKRSTR